MAKTPATNDLGARRDVYVLEALLLGADYDYARNTLLEELYASGKGTLVHPHLGTWVVQVEDWTMEESTEQTGITSRRLPNARLALLECDGQLDWQPNIWMGVSIENQAHIQRIEDLRGISAHLRFLSLEPLLGPLPNLGLSQVDGVITGGESGSDAQRDAKK